MSLRDAITGFFGGLRGKVKVNNPLPVNGGESQASYKIRVIDTMRNNPSQSNVPSSWSNAWLGPGAPIGGMVSLREKDAMEEPRTFDYNPNINATISPRIGYGLLPFTELRRIAESVPEVSMCVRIITEELKAFTPRIVYPDGTECKAPDLKWMWDRPDLFNPWPVWLSRFIYNVLVYDAGAIGTPRDSAGHIMAMKTIDGSTLFVLIDQYGDQPSPPSPAFAQVIHGLPKDFYNTHQIWYRPRHLRADAPYGRSPIEDALPAVNLLENLWRYEGDWYTTGNTPEQIFTGPQSAATPDQLLDFEDTFNSRMAGNSEERAGRIRFVPFGTQSLTVKDARFRDDVYRAAANAVRMSFGIPQTEVGESPGTGLGGSGFLEAMQNLFFRMALSPIKAYVESAFNDVLDENGYAGYRFDLTFPKESLDPSKEEDKTMARFTQGITTRDETREALGIKAMGGSEGAFMVTPGQEQAVDGGEMPGGKPQANSSIPASRKIRIAAQAPVSSEEESIPVNDSIDVKKNELGDGLGKLDSRSHLVANRKADRVRRQIEARVTEGALGELQWLREKLQPEIEQIAASRPVQKSIFGSADLWEQFRQRMHTRIASALMDGAINLADIYHAYWSPRPDDLTISPEDMAAEFQPVIGEMITRVKESVKRETGEAVTTWYNTPESTLQDLMRSLDPSFSEARARTISITEVTRLNSSVSRQTMEKLGIHRWIHNTRKDEVVCEICEPLNGQVFDINQPMPPENTHIGCRCFPTPDAEE